MSEDFQQSPYYFTMADTVYFFANVLMSTFLHRLTVKISLKSTNVLLHFDVVSCMFLNNNYCGNKVTFCP